MAKNFSRQIEINLTENQTIVDLSEFVQNLNSQIYIKKNVNGNIIEVNLNSFLGLITLQLKDKETVVVRTVGEDSEIALKKVIEFLT